ncbi:MAG: metal-dependent hydrolase [Opitutaceae bacterium]
MDPLTQASLGAAAAVVFSRKDNVRLAMIVGALAGAAPDLDVFIRSDSDPLLALEYHRHFTHALIFAPVIGLIVAGLYKLIFMWKRLRFRELATFGVAGALTHGLLDACTSYGTLLYLPFSNYRESWDIISIIDPIFTLPLVFMLLLTFCMRRPTFAKAATIFCLLYFCFGIMQRERAEDFVEQLAQSRGHEAFEQLTARPSFGNTILWRLVYRTGDDYYVDAVQLMPFSEPLHYPGETVKAFTIEDRAELLPDDSVLAGDVERFRFFSQNYLYRYPKDERVIGDMRYAMYPNSAQPLWGILLDPAKADAHTEFVYYRDASKNSFKILWDMILGRPLEGL